MIWPDFLRKMCHLKSTNQDSHALDQLDPIKNQVKRSQTWWIFEEDSLLSFCTADLSPSSRRNFFKITEKTATNLHFQKTVANHFGHLCLADGYLSTVCCYIKIWNPKKIWRNLNKNTEVVLVRGVSKRRSFWGWDFNRRREFPGMVLYLDVPEG